MALVLALLSLTITMPPYEPEGLRLYVAFSTISALRTRASISAEAVISLDHRPFPTVYLR